jgi:hypothetical protein
VHHSKLFTQKSELGLVSRVSPVQTALRNCTRDEGSGAATPQFIVFACDESGAKSYADRDEQLLGEVGVFAGIMVPGS